jgi:hypothetical protein
MSEIPHLVASVAFTSFDSYMPHVCRPIMEIFHHCYALQWPVTCSVHCDPSFHVIHCYSQSWLIPVSQVNKWCRWRLVFLWLLVVTNPILDILPLSHIAHLDVLVNFSLHLVKQLGLVLVLYSTVNTVGHITCWWWLRFSHHHRIN